MTAETLALMLVLLAVIIIGIWTVDQGRTGSRGSPRNRPSRDVGQESASVNQSSPVLRAPAPGGTPGASYDASERAVFQSIPLAEQARFAKEWRSLQLAFVDDPVAAVRNADGLTHEVLAAAGLPAANFEHLADDIERVYPDLVRHYRAAEVTAHANERGEAQIEDLRQAMVHYRALFHLLLETPSTAPEPERRARERVV